MEKKIEAGAKFFQTQAVYDLASLRGEKVIDEEQEDTFITPRDRFNRAMNFLSTDRLPILYPEACQRRIWIPRYECPP